MGNWRAQGGWRWWGRGGTDLPKVGPRLGTGEGPQPLRLLPPLPRQPLSKCTSHTVGTPTSPPRPTRPHPTARADLASLQEEKDLHPRIERAVGVCCRGNVQSGPQHACRPSPPPREVRTSWCLRNWTQRLVCNCVRFLRENFNFHWDVEKLWPSPLTPSSKKYIEFINEEINHCSKSYAYHESRCYQGAAC